MSVEPWDCLSCGARAQSKQFCETCGAAMPVEGEDSALSMMMGLVCEACDTFNDPGVTVCMTCAAPLGEPSLGDEPQVTPAEGSPRPISGVDAPIAASPAGSDASALGDGIEFDAKTQPPLAPLAPQPPQAPQATDLLQSMAPLSAETSPTAKTRPATSTSASAPTSTAAPPAWMSAPTGQPLATQFAMPKVDLASVAREGRGLTAPASSDAAAKLDTLPSRPTPAPLAPPMMPTATPLATPMPPPLSPAGAAAGATAAAATPGAGARAQKGAAPARCWRCGVDLQTDDKFCRNCGARSEAPVASPLATTQIAAAKMPGPLPSPVMPAGATMVMPAMRAAQQGVPGGADARAAASGGIVGAGATLMFSAQPGERQAKLILVRGQTQGASQWRLGASETWIGRAPPAGAHDAVIFADDPSMARSHCRLVFHGAELWLEPEPTVNGVFLRVREPVRLGPHDEMVVGAQRLRVMDDEDRAPVVAADTNGATRTLGSLVRQAPPIMLMRIALDPSLNEVFHRSQRLLTIGRNNCDLNFPRDSFVSERHAQITHEGSALVLEDLRSRNGTYVRARYATRLTHGDLVLLGDKVLRVELPR